MSSYNQILLFTCSDPEHAEVISPAVCDDAAQLMTYAADGIRELFELEEIPEVKWNTCDGSNFSATYQLSQGDEEPDLYLRIQQVPRLGS